MEGTKIDRLFGRDGEVAALRAFIDDVAAGPASLVLEGEVGAGKTALWRAAVAAARERGHRVLVSRATEGEASLAFAALGDLLRDVLDEGLSTLPLPQAAALRVAVLLQEPDGPPPDPLAVAVATLGLVRALAAERARPDRARRLRLARRRVRERPGVRAASTRDRICRRARNRPS